MPSPFSGMDPYLEGDLYDEFQQTLTHEISKQLLTTLPPRYVSLLARRHVRYQPSAGLPGLSALEHVVNSVVRVAEEVPVLSVEVRDVANRRLVTIIEILLPVNKVEAGAVGYAHRRRDILKTATHLLEIDLVRRGSRLISEKEPPPADYYAYLSRFTHRPLTDVWTIGLRDRLPVLPVPLLPPDEDVLLDLQRAADACYDLVHYERLLDYNVPPPPPPLSEADAAWVAERIVSRVVGQWVSGSVRQ